MTRAIEVIAALLRLALLPLLFVEPFVSALCSLLGLLGLGVTGLFWAVMPAGRFPAATMLAISCGLLAMPALGALLTRVLRPPA